MAQTLVAIVSAVLVLAWAPAASAQIWSAAGATGAVDESDRSMYVFGSNGAVAIRSSIARGTLNLRYPVQTVPNLLIPQGDCAEMRVLLRDTGAGGRVVVRLMQLGIAGGFEGSLEQVAEINSDGLQPVGDPNQYHSHPRMSRHAAGQRFPVRPLALHLLRRSAAHQDRCHCQSGLDGDTDLPVAGRV